MPYDPLPTYVENIARDVVDAAFHVHSELGPGLLESVYEDCLVHELELRGILCERQKVVPLTYKGKHFERGFRIDLLVGGAVIVEMKAVDATEPIHEAQLYTYLKLAEKRLGLPINFNTRLIKNGIKRIVC
jgi:GxxExxY protein